MRPGRFHPGNEENCYVLLSHIRSFNEAGAFPPRKFSGRGFEMLGDRIASMRPGRFHPGNRGKADWTQAAGGRASMRPGRFHPGNVLVRVESAPTLPLQ